VIRGGLRLISTGHHDNSTVAVSIGSMSDAYERERFVLLLSASSWSHANAPHRQNNSRLDELASKVSALRGVTVDIYDNARSQELIDNSVRQPSPSLI
jgi:hypothetical protein